MGDDDGDGDDEANDDDGYCGDNDDDGDGYAYGNVDAYGDDDDDDDDDSSVKRALKRRGWLEKPCDCCPKLPR